MTQYWLLKTEPCTYSLEQLSKDGKTNWNNVRNFQARNFLRQMKKGDVAVIYHSGDERAAVGLAQILKEAYIDPDPDGGDWVQVDIAFKERFPNRVDLKTIKKETALQDLALVRQPRLSVSPLTKDQFQILRELAEK